MAYQLSPGVRWSEFDKTDIVPATSTTEGGFAGDFEWGPIDHIMTVSNEIDLVRYFGKPSANTFKSFWTAANFLSYGQNLQLIRSANTLAALNATNGSTGILVKNKDDYETNYLDLSAANTAGMFAARYAGTLGNSVKVSLWASPVASSYDNWEYAEEFNGVPGTSVFATNRNLNTGITANDEMHIIVVDAVGDISGAANTVLEKFSFISKAIDATNDDGSSNYYVNVINGKSQYIYIMNHAQNTTTQAAESTTWGSVAQNTQFAQNGTHYTARLTRGVSATPTNGNLQLSFDKFANPDETDVSLIMTGDADATLANYIIQNVAERRKDAVAFVSPLYADVVDNAGNEASAVASYRNDNFGSSSYAVMDSGWKKQFDKYNNVFRWLPLNGDIAGLCARTDFNRDPWYSPAGLNRGGILNVAKLAWNPSQAERDTLYKSGVNPVVVFKGEGPILYGDKTMLAKPSAFDRINVRRLFIVLEKTIARAAKYSLFEFNDEFTRAQFVSLVEPFLRDVKGRRGIFDFKVVCDESNNTPEVIDRNEFKGDIYIKPARAINFIQLNFVAVRTGVAFSEIVGKY